MAEAYAEPSPPLILEVVQAQPSAKPCFTLNDEAFYPRLYSGHFVEFTPELVDSLRDQGVNSLQIALDTEEAQDKRLKKLLEKCQTARMPVILELNTWKMRQVLIDRPDLNMIQSDGSQVKYFPDYANKAALKEQLSRYIQAAKDIRRYLGQPVVAISVGAYDWYHLPDAEVHDDFVVPKHVRKNQTYLPYGKHVKEAFAKFLESRGVSMEPSKLKLPTSPEDAENEERWNDWLLFRRHLVREWLANTTNVVRKRTNVPVGVSFDLNFALREQFATPPYAFSGVIDFASVYCYGPAQDAAYVAPLMRTFYSEACSTGIPLLGFLEFSSGLAGKTHGDAYAKACAPFSAGLMTASPHANRNHDQSRIDSFIGWSKGSEAETLLKSEPKRADILLVMNRDAIDIGEATRKQYVGQGHSVDLLYVDQNWSGDGIEPYQTVVVSDDLLLPATGHGRLIRTRAESAELRKSQ